MAEVNLTGPLLSVVGIVLAILATWIYRRRQHWKSRGVPSFGNILYGDFKKMFFLQQSFAESLRDHYKKYKHLRFTGSFLLGRPTLLIHDPEIIKEVLKDARSFGGRGLYYDQERDPLSANLFFLEGDDWKNMRTKLTPSFTSTKIKYMFNTSLDCISKLEVQIEKERGAKPSIDIDSRDLMARLASDIILSVALGIDANAVENPHSKFRRIGKLVFDPSFTQFVKFTLFSNAHPIVRLLNLKVAPKETNDFFLGAVRDTVAYREANDVTRPDFLDLMIRLKNLGTQLDAAGETGTATAGENTTQGRVMTVNEISAQAFFFFLAGFETTSATLSFALYEVAKHPEVLRKIQAECDAAMQACGGKINFDVVQSLHYIEMAIFESQRIHPPVAHLIRSTLQSCTLPGTNIKLDKNTLINIPLWGLNCDPDFYPDPERFDPERFSPVNKDKIPQHIFMPFGEGPRICIGMRFAMVQVKATILSLLSKYDVTLAEGTPKTMVYDPRNLLPAPKFPLALKFTPRKNIN